MRSFRNPRRPRWARGDPPMTDTVELTIPVRADLVVLARLTAATVASRADFDVEEIEDLRLAVDELCISVIQGSADGRLDCSSVGTTMRSRCPASTTVCWLEFLPLRTSHWTDSRSGSSTPWSMTMVITRRMANAGHGCANGGPSDPADGVTGRFVRGNVRDLRRVRQNPRRSPSGRIGGGTPGVGSSVGPTFHKPWGVLRGSCPGRLHRLIKSVERFDLEVGVEFSTYATRTIMGELKRYFRDSGWAVRAPRRLQELYLELGQSIDSLSQELGRPPTISEMARITGASEEAV